MKNNKIGILISKIQNLGPVNVVRGLIKENKKYAFTVFCLTNSVDKNIYDELCCLGAKVILIPDGTWFSKILFVRSFLKEHPHNILHSHGITADMFSYFLNGVKISTIHNRLDEDYIPLFGAVKGNAIYYLHRFILRRFNHIVACSAAVQSKLKQSKVKTKITTIQNGIDITRFKTLESDKKKLLREKHGFDSEKRIFIYCGSLSLRKNIAYLLEHLAIEENDIFLILGDGELFRYCKDKYSKDLRYIFMGKFECPLEYYQLSDIFVSASLSEGLPLALLEAASTGCYLYVSDIEPHREIASLLGEENISMFKIKDGSYNYLQPKIKKADYNALSDDKLYNISDKKMSNLYDKLFVSLLEQRH